MVYASITPSLPAGEEKAILLLELRQEEGVANALLDIDLVLSSHVEEEVVDAITQFPRRQLDDELQSRQLFRFALPSIHVQDVLPFWYSRDEAIGCRK